MEFLDKTNNWQDFDKETITHTEAHFLLALQKLETDFGSAQLGHVADLLGVEEWQVFASIASLRRRELVVQNAQGMVGLSPRGREKAEAVYTDRQRLTSFFCEILGVGEEAASVGACRIEHLIGTEVSGAVRRLLDFLESEELGASDLRKGLARFHERRGVKDTA